MTDPLSFADATARFGLPFLFPAQAQRESFVNETAARCDVLLHCAVEAMVGTPPPSPSDGQCWLIGAEPSGVWIGKAGWLAAWLGGNWVFLEPRAGLRAYDRTAHQERFYTDAWQIAGVPTNPIGGAVVDSEARAAIAQIHGILATVGIIPT